MSRSQIPAALAYCGIRMRSRGEAQRLKRRIDHDGVLRMVAQGKTYAEIALAHGCTKHHVYLIVRARKEREKQRPNAERVESCRENGCARPIKS